MSAACAHRRKALTDSVMRRDDSRSRSRLRPTLGVARSLGAWFGILALLVQLVVAVLPIPSYAASRGVVDDLVHICTTHHATPAGQESPQTPHRHSQCPLCVAVNLGASLLPPASGNIIDAVQCRPIGLPLVRVVGPLAAARYTPQQPRGPPPVF